MEDKYISTISSTKEESILKALEVVNSENFVLKPNIDRPNIYIKKIILSKVCFLLTYIFMLGICHLLYIQFEFKFSICIGLLVIAANILFNLKRSIVNWVLLYQKLAPEKLRGSCRFEPSCSQYMLLSIEKYGIFKGLFKGICRLLRCHHPNGGVDYP